MRLTKKKVYPRKSIIYDTLVILKISTPTNITNKNSNNKY